MFNTHPSFILALESVEAERFVFDNLNYIEGNNKSNTIIGTNKGDRIYGLDGRDEIKSLGGDDRVFGGRNDDELRLGDGNDYGNGGDGDDIVYFNADGKDTINLETDLAIVTGGDEIATTIANFTFVPNARTGHVLTDVKGHGDWFRVEDDRAFFDTGYERFLFYWDSGFIPTNSQLSKWVIDIT